MKLVSMKKEGGHGKDCCCCDAAPSGCSEPDYPWGTRISLEEDQIAALGLKSMPAVGAPVGVEAVAMVIGVNEEQRDGKTFRRLELQITDLALAAAGTNKYARMYADDPSMKD
ncbi:hypothetical protein [Xanthomonas citri phage CP2]|uniref:hypothetical protein n=1 Tax=Xanthomonas citri phage CP2 TaxID=1188795 RepID=UPI00029B6D90|nr:hypothetical protein H390_gp13 [Xanthomonas citri phage CP2]BAM66435.1 hypothetical protein [Xanthomonas citri phage CP2]